MDTALIALGDYFRARRAVIAPEDVGLPRTRGRRVAGLRRDEVAELAGISNDYYLRIEQGRGARPSDQVMGAIARALRLDVESTAYAFRLVSGQMPRGVIHDSDAPDRIARTLSQWTHTPAYVSDPHRDIIASNPLATIFGEGGLAAGSNQVSALFNERMRRSLLEWETMARSAVATLRRDAHPHSPRLRELLRQLSVHDDFRRIWERHDVSGPEDATFRFVFDGVGEIAIDAQNFAVRSMPGYQLTVLSAQPGGLGASLFARLAETLPGGAAPAAMTGAER